MEREEGREKRVINGKGRTNTKGEGSKGGKNVRGRKGKVMGLDKRN